MHCIKRKNREKMEMKSIFFFNLEKKKKCQTLKLFAIRLHKRCILHHRISHLQMIYFVSRLISTSSRINVFFVVALIPIVRLFGKEKRDIIVFRQILPCHNKPRK